MGPIVEIRMRIMLRFFTGMSTTENQIVAAGHLHECVGDQPLHLSVPSKWD